MMVEHNETVQVMEPTKSESRNLILFLVITFAFSWGFWIPRALALHGRLGSSILTDFFLSETFNLGAFGPLVGAVVLTWGNE